MSSSSASLLTTQPEGGEADVRETRRRKKEKRLSSPISQEAFIDERKVLGRLNASWKISSQSLSFLSLAYCLLINGLLSSEFLGNAVYWLKPSRHSSKDISSTLRRDG